MPRRPSPTSPYADGEAFQLAKAALLKTPPDLEVAKELMPHMRKSDQNVIRRRIDRFSSDANRSDKE